MKTLLLDKWLLNLELKLKREKTIYDYNKNILKFYDYIIDKKGCLSERDMLKNISSDDVESYQYYLQKIKKYKLNTVQNYIEPINLFFNYLIIKGLINNNPCGCFERFSKKEIENNTKKKDILTLEECQLITQKGFNINIVSATSRQIFENSRNKLMWLLLVTTGMREKEILEIKLEDITARKVILIKNDRVKNHIDKRIPLKPFIEEYKKYIDQREKNKIESEYLFCSYNGKVLRDANHIFDRLMGKNNINKHITHHCFRYTSTYLLTDLNIKKDMIDKIVGWKDSSHSMQQRYLRDKDVNSSLDKEITGILNKLVNILKIDKNNTRQDY